ncbi:MAG: hypothetical protein ACSLFR_10305 [Solirubrobacteraceae bacterium]
MIHRGTGATAAVLAESTPGHGMWTSSIAQAPTEVRVTGQRRNVTALATSAQGRGLFVHALGRVRERGRRPGDLLTPVTTFCSHPMRASSSAASSPAAAAPMCTS